MKNKEKVLKDLKYYLTTNEEDDIVSFPKFVVVNMIKLLEREDDKNE